MAEVAALVVHACIRQGRPTRTARCSAHVASSVRQHPRILETKLCRRVGGSVAVGSGWVARLADGPLVRTMNSQAPVARLLASPSEIVRLGYFKRCVSRMLRLWCIMTDSSCL